MSKKTDRFKKRFSLNMNRIAGLVALAFSDFKPLKPKGVWHYDGAGADIFRAVVVFLHATFEDMLRSHLHNSNTRITFSGPSDIRKPLQMSGLPLESFKHLDPPLVQMARRRNRIVHYADLSSDGSSLDDWSITDFWTLLMWNLVVLSFYHQLLVAVGAATDADRKQGEGLKKGITEHVKLGHQLAAFAQVPKDLQAQRQALQAVRCAGLFSTPRRPI